MAVILSRPYKLMVSNRQGADGVLALMHSSMEHCPSTQVDPVDSLFLSQPIQFVASDICMLVSADMDWPSGANASVIINRALSK